MLPIEDALPALRAALADRNCAVLVAPPGAGKTTRVPLALLEEPWAADRRLVVLEPRRLAARAAAARMADMLSEPVGWTIGLRVRGESRVSARTRIEVVTDGVFTRLILADPGLDGIAAVLFDEFHERSLQADLGLAFARDAQAVLRDDLRLLVMSATLDGARVSTLLDGAPVVESLGRAFPVETRYLGGDQTLSIEEQTARAVQRALLSESGSVLAFLPGLAEIRRTETLLCERLAGDDVVIAPLHGALEPSDQARAVAPARPGERKVVLATSIAQTSLTIEGVRVVIDPGLSRAPRHDPASGLTRLVTVRVSRATADQRRGRAGRTEPGVCYRLWDEAESRGLAPFDRPEILEADLTGLALDLAAWGATSTDGFALLDAPPRAAFAEARATLQRLGALRDGSLTDHGRDLSGLPLPPRLAHMVLLGAQAGEGRLAAEIAAILTERGLGGTGVELATRLERFRADRGRRAFQARTLAERWSAFAKPAPTSPVKPPRGAGLLLALAYPERIARRSEAAGEFQMANGRRARLDPGEALAGSEWLAVAEAAGGGPRDRILLAAAIDPAALLVAVADQLSTEARVEVDGEGRVRAWEERRLGALVVDARPMVVQAAERLKAFACHLAGEGLSALPAWARTADLRGRVAFLRALDSASWPDLGAETLLPTVESWLGSPLGSASMLKEVSTAEVEQALWLLIGPERRRELDRLAPERLITPAGTSHPIDYAAEGGPRVEVRVQALFGLAEHPMVAGGRVPLTLALLSPAHRPVQLTRDLPGFWAGSWKAVRTEMRGRYPKHPWPEDPLAAAPTTRAKPRGA